MTDRAKSLAGTLDIRSKPGAGTTVRVEVPIEEGAE
jgi:signal transduction histidine kinase